MTKMNKQITILLSFFLVILVGTGSFLYFQSLGDTVEDSEALVPSLEDETVAETEPSSPLIEEEDKPPIEEDTSETEPPLPPTEEEGRPDLEDRPDVEMEDKPPMDDELGVFNLTRTFITGLETIIDEEGTTVNVLDLVGNIEVQLTEITQGIDLTDEQTSMVQSLSDTLNTARDLAQDGESPSVILSQIQPDNRPK